MALLRTRSSELRAVTGDLHRMVIDALTTAPTADAPAVLAEVATRLREGLSLRWIAVYATEPGASRAHRVALSIGEASARNPDERLLLGDPQELEPAIPTSIDPATATNLEGPELVDLGSGTFLYAPEADHLGAIVSRDPRGTSALGRLVAALAEPVMRAREQGAKQLDLRLQRDMFGAIADDRRAVDLLLRMVLVGFSGERGFVTLLDVDGDGTRKVLAVHGDCDPFAPGLDVEELGGEWIATVSDPAALAPGAHAVYAVARRTNNGVLVVVVMSAAGARALSERTIARVEGAIGTMVRLLDLDESLRRTVSQTNAVLDAVVHLIDVESPDEVPHSRAVEQEATRFARILGADDATVKIVARASHLHDIGRVAEAVDGSSTSIEFQHPSIGAALLEAFDEPPEVCRLVAMHHERADGLGYPNAFTPDGGDAAAWAIIAAECVASHAAWKRLDLSSARDEWLRDDAQRILPSTVLRAITAA